MNLLTLVRRNILHFWQTNLAVVGGVAVAVGVLAGALLVGSSVKASLRALALERLGAVDSVVTSSTFVSDGFAEDLLRQGTLADVFGSAAPMIAVEGFVTHQESGRRASNVQVYGVDDRFWAFHGADSEAFRLERSGVFVSEGLARELEADNDDALLVRVEMPSAIPLSSLHGRRDDVGRTLRLGIDRVLTADENGEFSFRPQQGRARSVFVSLTRLQQEIEQEGRVNTVLLGGTTASVRDDASLERQASAEAAVRAVASLGDIGLRVRVIPEQATFAVEATAGLINDATAEVVDATADALGLDPEPVLTYLANQLRRGDRVTPYSLVTAVGLDLVSDVEDGLTAMTTGPAPVVLNEWAAEDLEAQVGDVIELGYHVWEDAGRLGTRDTELRVVDIIPIAGTAADPTLAPDYPGITEANDLIGWDPPFEIDLTLIRPKDEDYWDDYRTTPKAFVPLETGQRLWRSRWGALTAIRLRPQGDLEQDADRFRAAFRAAVDPLAVGFVVYPARTLALEASSGATDFGLYFFYFSFFLVVSALLLASLFFRLGVEQRLTELGLLRAVGFPPRAVRRLFSTEALVLSLLGSVLGVVAAVAYGELIMWGLRTWWVDAVGTTRLRLFVSFTPLAGGAVGGILAAFLSIAWTLRSLAPATPRSLLSGVLDVSGAAGGGGRSRAVPLAGVLFVAGVGLVTAAASGVLGATAGFFAGGLVLLCGMLASAWAWLHSRPRRRTSGSWSVIQVGFRNATARPGRSVLCIALIASATFIIVAVDAFHREGGGDLLDPSSGTGGYTLLADTLLPIAHDPSTLEGRDALNIGDLHEPGGDLEGVALSRFRLRPGEDASCLNLYQAKDPRIIAPTPAFIDAGRFSFAWNLAETPEETANPWLLLDREFDDGAIPAIADLTSLTYALHLAVGDDFILNRDTDHPIRLRIVAALSDSIFQRELVIAEDRFEQVFPDYDGYRFFLVDAPIDRAGAVSAALEDRLADFGFDVVSAGDRLASFHRVENTYLATFQALGGLGLVLGTFGLGAVLLRNVLERRRELALLRAVGYNAGHLSMMVLAENAVLLFLGLFAGTACALVAIAPAWIERGGGVPVVSLSVLLLLVVAVGLLASLAATAAAVRSPLLRALRTE